MFPLAPAHLAWLGAVQVSLALAFYDITLAVIPLVLFLVVTFTAPFFPRFPFFLPIVSRGPLDKKAVALSFDDGPDKATTSALLDLLDETRVKAAFFVTGENAEACPDLVKSIRDRGHEIGNHSFSHDPLLMLRSVRRLEDEIAHAQKSLEVFGIQALAFRPPAGIVSPRLWRVLLKLGMYCVTFSNRPRDFGNRRVDSLAKRVLAKLKNGDIIVLHDRACKYGMNNPWLAEMRQIIHGIRSKGYRIVPLGELIGRPVCIQKSRYQDNSISLFYNSLASDYDNEQMNTGVSLVRKKELDLFRSARDRLLSADMTVLELGAGTGLFTLDIARFCKNITALDISAEMIERLNKKASGMNLCNIRTVIGDMESSEIEGPFDRIFAFSSLEYAGDLERLMKKMALLLKPGGRVYVTTGHASVYKLFAQIGNAMRQGMWLHARSHREIKRACRGAELKVLYCKTHLCSFPVLGGMLLEFLVEKPDQDG